MSDFGLVPKYTEADYQTLVDRLKTILSKTDTFKDYDFEGANITLLMELLSYIGDLNTYYTNRLAQNIHTDTANIYEAVHSLVKQQGYVPTGHISSEVTLTVRVRQQNDTETFTYYVAGDQLYIPRWFKVNTGLTTDAGDIIYYCMPEDFTFNVLSADILVGYDAELDQNYNYVEFDITMKQGEPLLEPLSYTGDDIVSNQIVLPLQQYDTGLYPYEDTLDSLLVTVGDAEDVWERVSDFFDDVSGLQDEENVYIFSYDKYKRAVLSFTNTRNVPSIDDGIVVYPIKTLGTEGVISVNTFGNDNKPNTSDIYDVGTKAIINNVPFVKNITSDVTVTSDRYTVLNNSASVGGADIETIDELKIGGVTSAHSQLRNVTKADYKGHLESRGDITIASVWGEQEQNPEVLETIYYNRAYISLIPTEWATGVDNNISLSQVVVQDDFSGGTSELLDYPADYDISNTINPDWKTDLLEYLEPRKMLGIWEEFILPELVYFRFDFGLKVQRTYSFTQVKETVKNKLTYYFRNEDNSFGSAVDFREIFNYIMDLSNVSPDDDFALVRGIQSLVIRDVLIHRDPSVVETIDNQPHCEGLGGTWTASCSITPDEMYIYPENLFNYFPQYIDTGYSQSTVDNVYNILQPIQLGSNQFPQLAVDFCVFANEG